MELDAADRRYKAIHEKLQFHDGTFTDWVEKADRDHPYHFMAGVRLYVSETEDTSEDFLSPPRLHDAEDG